MASTYQCQLLHDLSPMLHLYFEADTTVTSVINVGDLVQVNPTTQKVILFEDDNVASASYKFCGISNTYWTNDMNDYKTKNMIEVIGYCVVHATLRSGTYLIGELVAYDEVADDGTLKSWESGDQPVGWIWECATGTITKGHVLINILEPSVQFLEVYS